MFTVSGIASWSMACFIFIALYGSYIKFFVYMRKNREILDRPSTRAKYGTLYDGFEPIDSSGEIKYIEFYSLTFFLRRGVFVMLTFTLFNYAGL